MVNVYAIFYDDGEHLLLVGESVYGESAAADSELMRMLERDDQLYRGDYEVRPLELR